MLQRQNELLRSSEAAYQREAQLVSGTWHSNDEVYYTIACHWRPNSNTKFCPVACLFGALPQRWLSL
jgi:hypothetical protein